VLHQEVGREAFVVLGCTPQERSVAEEPTNFVSVDRHGERRSVEAESDTVERTSSPP
jgi:hypothetical protein